MFSNKCDCSIRVTAVLGYTALSWLINNNLSKGTIPLNNLLLDHDDHTPYYWSSYIHDANTVKI